MWAPGPTIPAWARILRFCVAAASPMAALPHWASAQTQCAAFRASFPVHGPPQLQDLWCQFFFLSRDLNLDPLVDPISSTITSFSAQAQLRYVITPEKWLLNNRTTPFAKAEESNHGAAESDDDCGKPPL